MVDYLSRARSGGRVPDAILIDAFVEGQMGGTGDDRGCDVLDCIPPLPRLILAGGLTPENVAAKVARVFDPGWSMSPAESRSLPAARIGQGRAFVKAARIALL